MDNRCTCYFNGNWLWACRKHDYASADAWLRRSAEERLEADIELHDDVLSTDHPIHALVMFAGVRAWYWLKWRLVDGIKFNEQAESSRALLGRRKDNQ